MQEGFVLEQNFSNYVPSVWVEGKPEPSFFTVTKVFGKTKRVVTSYRCAACGYLESYALKEWTGDVNPK